MVSSAATTLPQPGHLSPCRSLLITWQLGYERVLIIDRDVHHGNGEWNIGFVCRRGVCVTPLHSFAQALTKVCIMLDRHIPDGKGYGREKHLPARRDPPA